MVYRFLTVTFQPRGSGPVRRENSVLARSVRSRNEFYLCRVLGWYQLGACALPFFSAPDYETFCAFFFAGTGWGYGPGPTGWRRRSGAGTGRPHGCSPGWWGELAPGSWGRLRPAPSAGPAPVSLAPAVGPHPGCSYSCLDRIEFGTGKARPRKGRALFVQRNREQGMGYCWGKREDGWLSATIGAGFGLVGAMKLFAEDS